MIRRNFVLYAMVMTMEQEVIDFRFMERSHWKKLKSPLKPINYVPNVLNQQNLIQIVQMELAIISKGTVFIVGPRLILIFCVTHLVVI